MSLVSPPSSNGWTILLKSLNILLRIRGFVSLRYGFKKSDPYQNVTDPELWYTIFHLCMCTASVRAARYKLHNGTASWVLSFVDYFSSAVCRLPIGQSQTAARLPIGRATACPRLVDVDAETLPLGFEHYPCKIQETSDYCTVYTVQLWDGIFKHLRSPGIDSVSLCNITWRANAIPTRFPSPP